MPLFILLVSDAHSQPHQPRQVDLTSVSSNTLHAPDWFRLQRQELGDCIVLNPIGSIGPGCALPTYKAEGRLQLPAMIVPQH